MGRGPQIRSKLAARAAVLVIAFHLVRPAPAQITVTPTGSITANFSSSTDDSGNTNYSFINASSDLTVGGLPPIPLSAQESGYWTSPTTWNGGYIFVALNAITVYNYVNGVLDSDGLSAITDTQSTVNTLVNSGPTEQTIPIPGLSLESDNVPGVNQSFGVSATLTYDVTIPTNINVTMDQPTVAIHSLFLEPGAALTANGNFTVRTDLTNQGTLTNLGGTVQGNFNNSSYADITGQLSVQGTFTNYGTVAIESNASLNLSQDTTNNGEIDMYGGSISAPETFVNNGTFKWYGGNLPGSFQNSKELIIYGSGNQAINAIATLTNGGTIVQSGGASLTMYGTTNTYNGAAYPSALNNLSGATYDIQGDGGITDPANGSYYTAPNATFNNAGLFEKTSGSGITAISEVVFNNTGTVEVDCGTLHFQGTLTNSGLINIAGGTLISDNGIGGDSILAQIQSGYDHGKWDGSAGITSTVAAATPGTAVGYAINGNSVTLTFTWLGDTDLNGIVNAADLQNMAPAGTTNATWSQGDFNYDDIINADDYSLFMLGAASCTTNISNLLPEPSAALLLVTGCLVTSLSRKRPG